jgi:hypothetical protein
LVLVALGGACPCRVVCSLCFYALEILGRGVRRALDTMHLIRRVVFEDATELVVFAQVAAELVKTCIVSRLNRIDKTIGALSRADRALARRVFPARGPARSGTYWCSMMRSWASGELLAAGDDIMRTFQKHAKREA